MCNACEGIQLKPLKYGVFYGSRWWTLVRGHKSSMIMNSEVCSYRKMMCLEPHDAKWSLLHLCHSLCLTVFASVAHSLPFYFIQANSTLHTVHQHLDKLFCQLWALNLKFTCITTCPANLNSLLSPLWLSLSHTHPHTLPIFFSSSHCCESVSFPSFSTSSQFPSLKVKSSRSHAQSSALMKVKLRIELEVTSSASFSFLLFLLGNIFRAFCCWVRNSEN